MIIAAKLNRNPLKNCRCDDCDRWLYQGQEWHIRIKYDAPETVRVCVGCALRKQRLIHNPHLKDCLDVVQDFVDCGQYVIQPTAGAHP